MTTGSSNQEQADRGLLVATPEKKSEAETSVEPLPAAALLSSGAGAPAPQAAAGLAESTSREQGAAVTLSQETPHNIQPGFPASRAMMSKRNLAALPDHGQFTQALQQAQDAASEEARQQIWRDFLKTNPDTAYYLLAVGNLARSLSAGTDSASSREQIEKTLKFYQQMAPVLATQFGLASFQNEYARLEGLLQWKK
jgi:hypothetical protein